MLKLERFHEDSNTLHVGVEKDRSYYIPAIDEKKAIVALEGESTSKKSLNGEWNVTYFNYYEDAISNIVENNNQVAIDKKVVEVPSCLQYHGFDNHMYTNVHYPFPYDPPYVPDKNPCALYEKKYYTQMDKESNLYLNFEGVDSCFYLWINDTFAGYSQVSHSTSEFDITKYLVDGENDIKVLVLKWCDGSYLEDQDKLRMTGIFRDVYILERPKNFIRDFSIDTHISSDLSKATISSNLIIEGNIDIVCRLYSPDGQLLEEKKVADNNIEFNVNEPILWNAENPQQYIITYTTKGESIAQYVGIRKIEIKDGIILLNNSPIKFFGVNRHDSDPFTGASINRQQAFKDLMIMKQNNINAIRTSHYPNSPWFLQMCSKYGFYVIGEADIECHGVVTKNGYYGNNKLYSETANNPLFKEAILDRVQKCVIRDKNNASIIMWSLGNESGYGVNFEEAGRWVKEYDQSRLVHYEGAFHPDEDRKNDFSMLDVYSRMYAKREEIDAYFQEKKHHKPFIQCEFIHAMGNGPGDIEEYMQQIFKYDGFAGGFVWEWCDHAIYGGTTPEGKEIFRYGGDSNEEIHDGNFCLDGMVTPTRLPKQALREYKNCIRPIRITLLTEESTVEELKFNAKSNMSFTNISDVITVQYTIYKNGLNIKEGKLENFNIEPLQSKTFTIQNNIDISGDMTIVFTYTSCIDTEFYEEGHELGFDECIVNKADLKITKPQGGEVKINEDYHRVVISSSNFKYEIDKHTAMFTSIVYKNESILIEPGKWNIWRATTDNDDNRMKGQWLLSGYDRVKTKVYSLKSEINSDGLAIITAQLSLAPLYITRVMDIDVRFIIGVDGVINIELKGSRNMSMPFLPRFGIVLPLKKSFNECKYFGYGPNQSYADMHRASKLGIFENKVSNMYESYIVPQESSSHFDTRYVILSNNECSLKVEGEKPFSFSAINYTQEELQKKMHDYELEESNATVLSIDVKMSGLGSESCGQQVFPQYQVNDEVLKGTFSIIPMNK